MTAAGRHGFMPLGPSFPVKGAFLAVVGSSLSKSLRAAEALDPDLPQDL